MWGHTGIGSWRQQLGLGILSWPSFGSQGLAVVLSVGVHPRGVRGAEAGTGWGPVWGHCTVPGQAPFLAAQLQPCCSRGTQPMGLYLDLPASEKGCRSRNLGEKLGFVVVFIS